MDGIDCINVILQDKFRVRIDRRSKTKCVKHSEVESKSVYLRDSPENLGIDQASCFAGASLHGPRDSSARVAGVPGSFCKTCRAHQKFLNLWRGLGSCPIMSIQNHANKFSGLPNPSHFVHETDAEDKLRTCCACTCKDYVCIHSQPKWPCHFGSSLILY